MESGVSERTYRIAEIPGDGIGKEVVSEAVQVMERAGDLWGFRLQWDSFDWGCERYTRVGNMMPADGIDQLREYDAIFLGAVGYPTVPDHLSLWGLLMPIRRAFEQYINLRPVRLLEGLDGPLRSATPADVDMVIVRENNEGEYSEVGGRLYRGTEREISVQESIFTRHGVERVLRYAFEVASGREKSLVSATKSNGIVHTMPFWDEIYREVAKEYESIDAIEYHVDALAARFILEPESLDVVVASNLFGDILSDIGAAVAGSIGIAPSANLNPERKYPSMFEPVHGSAPGIVGKGIANPIAQIWSGAMMLEHLGEMEAASGIVDAISDVFQRDGPRTPDLKGSAKTVEVTAAVLEALAHHSRS